MDKKQVLGITTEGLTYIDNDSNQKFINFTDCFNTYLKWRRWSLSTPSTSEPMAEVYRTWKQVGEVDYVGGIMDFPDSVPTVDNLPYVVFYDNQATHFFFSTQNECAEFHQRVIEAGWTLFDLSD